MHKLVSSIIGLTVLGCSAAAQAADNGIYLGAGVGRATVEIDNISSGALDFDGDDTGYKIIAGIRPLDWLAIEANYVNFGEPDDSPGGVRLRTKGDGLGAYALGLFAVGPVDLFAKAGVVRWNSELRHPQLGRLDDDDGTDFAYGVGVQFRLLSLGVRGEYEVFDIDGVDKANMISLSVTYTFF
jgi:opacity protein-like surface antigen